MYILLYTSDMSKRYSLAEARAKLPTLLDEVEAGQEIELTRRGAPVAMLLSYRNYDRLRAGHSTFKKSYQEFLKRHSLAEIGFEEDYFGAARPRERGREVRL